MEFDMIEYKVKVHENGDKCWYLDGKLHREDGPAVELANGDKAWYLNGKKHREDGPAIEYADGSKIWYIDGKRHREYGPAAEYTNGTKYWYLNGKLVTEDKVMNRSKELTVAEISKLLGYEVKIVKG